MKQIKKALIGSIITSKRVPEYLSPHLFFSEVNQKIVAEILSGDVEYLSLSTKFDPTYISSCVVEGIEIAIPETGLNILIKAYEKEQMRRSLTDAIRDLENAEPYQIAKKLSETLKERKDYTENKVKPLSEMTDEGEDIRYSTGFPRIDAVLMDEDLIGTGVQGGIALGEFVTIAGRPKCGKTLLAAQITASLTRSGLKTLWMFYEGKRRKLKKILDRAGAVQGNVLSVEFAKGEEMISRVDWIERQLAKAKEIYGAQVLVIDNLDFLEAPDGDKAKGEYEVMKIVVTRLAKIAVQHNIILILLAHVRKPANSSGAPRRPMMHDIAGTSQVGRLCDIGIIVDREHKEDLNTDFTNIILESNRPSGMTKEIQCLYENGKLIDTVEATNNQFNTTLC